MERISCTDGVSTLAAHVKHEARRAPCTIARQRESRKGVGRLARLVQGAEGKKGKKAKNNLQG